MVLEPHRHPAVIGLALPLLGTVIPDSSLCLSEPWFICKVGVVMKSKGRNEQFVKRKLYKRKGVMLKRLNLFSKY